MPDKLNKTGVASLIICPCFHWRHLWLIPITSVKCVEGRLLSLHTAGLPVAPAAK